MKSWQVSLSVFSCFAAIVIQTAGAAPSTQPHATELARKDLGNGITLVVVYQPIDAGPALSAMLREPPEKPTFLLMYSVSVQVMTADSPPQTLCTKVFTETDDGVDINHPFRVLDVVSYPAVLVVVCGMSQELALWKIEFGRFSADAWVRLRFWEARSRGTSVDQEAAKVQLTRDDAGAFTVEVTDLRVHPTLPPSIYRQIKDQWRFEQVRGPFFELQRGFRPSTQRGKE